MRREKKGKALFYVGVELECPLLKKLKGVVIFAEVS